MVDTLRKSKHSNALSAFVENIIEVTRKTEFDMTSILSYYYYVLAELLFNSDSYEYGLDNINKAIDVSFPYVKKRFKICRCMLF